MDKSDLEELKMYCFSFLAILALLYVIRNKFEEPKNPNESVFTKKQEKKAKIEVSDMDLHYKND